MIQPLNQAASATASSSGTATFVFPSVPTGLAWTGTVGVFNAPTTATFSARVGVASAGQPWGSWAGNGTFGPVQALGMFTTAIDAVGLTPGVAYQAWWIGSSCFEWEAEPVSPSALTTAVVASSAAGYTSPWTDANTLAYVVDNLAAGGGTSGDYRTISVNGVSLAIEFFDFTAAATVISTNTNLGDATPDTRMVVARYQGDLTVDAGVTLSTAVAKRGFTVLVRGNLTVNGTITQTARGANAAGQNVLITTSVSVAAAGGAGGVAAVGNPGTAGTAGASGTTGGGGAGAEFSPGDSGNGAAGTSYSGGTGGGGAQNGTASVAATAGTANGGAGGAGASIAAGRGAGGGGAGNPGGAAGSTNGGAGVAGTGGLLVLIVTGNATVGGAGVCSANGSAGGTGGGTADPGCGGGGSGGGSVNLVYHGTLTNNGTLQATGGAGGAGGAGGGSAGGAGGAGTARAVAA